ncbi:MAG: hypothetical protein NTX44_09960 [Ignavibacteriales bacterium]|nr:hypothetical protein [Ignavibacteriales bacterium]
MNHQHNTLHELLSIQAGSINNLFSYEAKSYKGSLLQVNKDIKKYVKAGWVQQIPFDIRPRNKRQQYFYFVTRGGTKVIDRLEDFKQKITKSLNNAEHESMKFDVALSFLRNFPDCEFDFNYKADFNGIRPDIFIKAKNIHDHREYSFFVEIERKKEFTRISRDKILRYNKFIKEGLFTKNGLSPKTKILFVCANHRFDIYMRPIQYSEPLNRPTINLLYKQFEYFLSGIKDISDKHFRFIPFPEFTDIAKPIWRMPSGTKVKIIE